MSFENFDESTQIHGSLQLDLPDCQFTIPPNDDVADALETSIDETNREQSK